MAASYSDSWQLSQSTNFLNRVQSALTSACVSIANEARSVAFHPQRANFAATILGYTAGSNPYIQLFCNTVSCDTTCIGDATQGGTVVLTAANRDAQGALVTDAHILAAVSSDFNTFIQGIG
jgi:hypothetical protein